MATPPRPTTQRPVGAPSPRATSTRELPPGDEKATRQMDPSALQQQAAKDAYEADPKNNPPPQRGMSSSELNSATPAQKAKATEEASKLPNNTDPKEGVSESQANSAQKKFDKDHE